MMHPVIAILLPKAIQQLMSYLITVKRSKSVSPKQSAQAHACEHTTTKVESLTHDTVSQKLGSPRLGIRITLHGESHRR